MLFIGYITLFLINKDTQDVFGATLPVETNAIAINTEVASIFSELQTTQNNYFKTKKKYFQGILPPLKSGDTKTSFDKTLKPTDQTETWADFGFVNDTTLISYAIDVYEGPNGKGYTIRAEFKKNGEHYAITRHYGPETYRDSNNDIWHKVISP